MEDSQKTNFAILIVSTFIVTSSMTMIMPFLSLYISTFGHFSDNYVQKWTGLIFSATFISAFLMSPVWGRVADKYGYKPIMIINCIGMAFSIFLMSYVNSVEQFFIVSVFMIIPQAFVTTLWQFILLRFFFGIFSGGFIPITVAMVRQEAPLEIQGQVMGYNQSFMHLGNIIGPISGGMLSGMLSIHSVFFMTGLLFIIAAMIILTLRRNTSID